MEKRKPKLLIIGHGTHGKDTVAALLAKKMGLKFTSSSLFVGQEIIWDMWGKERYDSFDNMYNDRVNYRTVWGDLISAYNTPDKSRTATTMLKRGNHMYVGMRRPDELEACKKEKLFDYIIWVDACERLPIESTNSMRLTHKDADVFFDNNGLEIDLDQIVDPFIKKLTNEGFNTDPKGTAIKTNIILTEPKIFAIGQTQFNPDEFNKWTDHNDLNDYAADIETPLGRLWRDLTEDDAIARMIEFGGRHCYRAWEKGRTRIEYIHNILDMEHGSVTEHATINWGIQGVSRSLSLELARHRVGIALSQESQRYVDASDINFVIPPILLDMNDAGLLEEFYLSNMDALDKYKELQSGIADHYADNPNLTTKQKTMVQKRANEAARALLPNDTETRFLWTTNMRILMHFLWLRGGSGADLEIRRLAVALLAKAQEYAPELFNRMTTMEIEDGYGVPVIVST